MVFYLLACVLTQQLALYAVLPPPKIEQPVLPPPKVEHPKPEVKPVPLPVQQAEVWMPLSLLIFLSNYCEAEVHFVVNL
jgi:hypothetical protein